MSRDAFCSRHWDLMVLQRSNLGVICALRKIFGNFLTLLVIITAKV